MTKPHPVPDAPPENASLLREFWLFLRQNRKWWLLPMVAVVLLLGLVLILSATPLSPFLYTLF